MKSSLAVFVCLFSAAVAWAQAPGPIEQPSFGVPKVAVVQDPTPCQRCGNEPDAMPYFDRRWPPLYQGGPPVRSPNAFYDTGRLTWWFIPTPRALVQAICP